MKAADKGPGSVRAGISKMQDYTIVVTKTSENIAIELNNYKWADKKSGVPIDKHNHHIDSIRYALEALLGNSGKYAYGS
jgi:phage terminase large subunit